MGWVRRGIRWREDATGREERPSEWVVWEERTVRVSAARLGGEMREAGALPMACGSEMEGSAYCALRCYVEQGQCQQKTSPLACSFERSKRRRQASQSSVFRNFMVWRGRESETDGRVRGDPMAGTTGDGPDRDTERIQASAAVTIQRSPLEDAKIMGLYARHGRVPLLLSPDCVVQQQM